MTDGVIVSIISHLSSGGLVSPNPCLITRPRREAEILAEQLRSLGMSVLIEPMIEITVCPEALPDLAGITTLVTTSANAIHALAMTATDRTLPLWCVGDASAATAQHLGFKNVRTAGGSVQSLLKCLLAENQQTLGHTLYLRGDVISFDLKQALCEHGYPTQEACLYQTQEALAFSETTCQAILQQHLANVLFFSPRAVSVFAKLCHIHNCVEACHSLRAVCYGSLSATMAAEGGLPWQEIVLV